jgi:hypothetical protein
LFSGVKRALSYRPSSRGSRSRSSNNKSQVLSWSSSVVPSLYETVGSSRYLAHNDVPEAMDGVEISFRSSEEMQKYESLRHREFAHTHVYDVNILERVGLDEELHTILRAIGWGKL